MTLCHARNGLVEFQARFELNLAGILPIIEEALTSFKRFLKNGLTGNILNPFVVLDIGSLECVIVKEEEAILLVSICRSCTSGHICVVREQLVECRRLFGIHRINVDRDHRELARLDVHVVIADKVYVPQRAEVLTVRRGGFGLRKSRAGGCAWEMNNEK